MKKYIVWYRLQEDREKYLRGEVDSPPSTYETATNPINDQPILEEIAKLTGKPPSVIFDYWFEELQDKWLVKVTRMYTVAVEVYAPTMEEAEKLGVQRVQHSEGGQPPSPPAMTREDETFATQSVEVLK